MEDIGKELCERVREVFEQRNSSNAFMVRLKDEIARGTATMRDTSLYSQTLGIHLRRAIKEVVTPDELPDSTLYYNIAHSILEPLLRDTYEDVNAVCAEVQLKLDDKAGIHLASQKADFPAERVRAACGSASVKDTAEHGIEVLERTSENITAAFSDDYMKANADFRSRAGLDTYIERRDDGKCCEWCSKIAGRYSYPDGAPRDIFRRHDNCGCTVEYVCSKGRQDVWSKKWASEPKKIEYSKPTVLTKEQAAELEKRLTIEKKDGTIGLGAKTGGKGTIPLHDEPKLIRTIDPLDMKAVQREIEEFEKWAINSKIENACVITVDGQVYYCYGVKDYVYPNYDLGDKLYGAIVSHNHVRSETEFSFSGDDFDLFNEYRLKKLRGIDYKYEYELSREYSDVPSLPEELTYELSQHFNIIRMADSYGFGYRRAER